MTVLHLASFDRWSGAAAPALAETEALRAAGIESHYAFTGGYTLEERLAGVEFAWPALERGHGPIAISKSVSSLRKLIGRLSIDILHCHLSHDHWLGLLASRSMPGVRLVRTYHSRRAVRTDPITRRLMAATDSFAVVNPEIARHPALSSDDQVFVTPPPVEPRYTNAGPDMRDEYGIDPDEPVIGFIGKMTRNRGFQEAVRTFSMVRESVPDARMLVVGKGPFREELEAIARDLGVADRIVWAGYHEKLLPEHFRTMNVLLFTKPGSDEGHRAIPEAMACGTPAVSWPVTGARYVMGDLSRFITREPSVESLAEAATRVLLTEDSAGLSAKAVENSERFSYARCAAQLRNLYDALPEPGLDSRGRS